MREAANPEKLVGALISGLKVLRYLSQTNSPVGVSQVARDLEINPSTCFNLLRTLVYENLVTFDSKKKTYAVGLGMLELTKGLTERDKLTIFIRPKLEELAVAHRVTATLWQRVSDDRVVLVDRADSDSAIRVHMTIGQRLPVFVAALGRCMAAHSGLGRDELRRRFNNLRWDAPPDFETFYSEVNEARKHGYAVDHDNFVRGVTTVSSPILDSNGVAICAISAVGFSGQFTEASLKSLSQELRQHADEITSALGGGALPHL